MQLKKQVGETQSASRTDWTLADSESHQEVQVVMVAGNAGPHATILCQVCACGQEEHASMVKVGMSVKRELKLGPRTKLYASP